MANEADVRARVGKYLRECGFFTQPIETGSIVEGVPDLYYQEPGTLGWLELKKVTKIPALASTSLFKSANHPLGTYQCNWINRCNATGGRADILVAYERRYFFVPGEFADDFNELTWKELQKFEINKDGIPIMLRKHR